MLPVRKVNGVIGNRQPLLTENFQKHAVGVSSRRRSGSDWSLTPPTKAGQAGPRGLTIAVWAKARSNFVASHATVARNADREAYRVGGVSDHVHLALRRSRTISIADLVETLKTSSSKWLKKQSMGLGAFAWQRGYECFSVSPKDVPIESRIID